MNKKSVNNNMSTSAKLPYYAPSLEVYKYAVEHGFADSLLGGSQPFGEAGSGGAPESSKYDEDSEVFHGEWY